MTPKSSPPTDPRVAVPLPEVPESARRAAQAAAEWIAEQLEGSVDGEEIQVAGARAEAASAALGWFADRLAEGADGFELLGRTASAIDGDTMAGADPDALVSMLAECTDGRASDDDPSEAPPSTSIDGKETSDGGGAPGIGRSAAASASAGARPGSVEAPGDVAPPDAGDGGIHRVYLASVGTNADRTATLLAAATGLTGDEARRLVSDIPTMVADGVSARDARRIATIMCGPTGAGLTFERVSPE